MTRLHLNFAIFCVKNRGDGTFSRTAAEHIYQDQNGDGYAQEPEQNIFFHVNKPFLRPGAPEVRGIPFWQKYTSKSPVYLLAGAGGGGKSGKIA